MMEIVVMKKNTNRSRADPKDVMEFIKKLEKANNDSLWMRLFPNIFPSDEVEKAGSPIFLDELDDTFREAILKIIEEKKNLLKSLTEEVTRYFHERNGVVNSGLRKALEGEWAFARELIRKGEKILEEEVKKERKS